MSRATFNVGGRIIIDGREFTGSTVNMFNGRVTIDGKPIDGQLSGVVEIRIVEGTIHHLTTDASVTAGQITGDVSAGGSVTAGDVGGGATAGGSIRCGKVGGSVMAGGSVRIT